MVTFSCNTSLGSGYSIRATIYVSAQRINYNTIRVTMTSGSNCSLTPKLHNYYVGVYATHAGVTGRLHAISGSKSGGAFPVGYHDFYDTDPTSTYSISLEVIDSYGDGFTGGTGTIGTYTFNVGAGIFTVSYNKNHSATKVSNMPDSQTKYYGKTLELSSKKPTAESDLTSVTIKFDGNGGNNVASKSANYGSSYTFKNWNTSAGGGGTSYSPGDSYTYNNSQTLYAQWTKKTVTASIKLPTTTRSNSTSNGYKITYDPKGGSTTPNPSYAINTTSYTFKNWNDKKDGSGQSYAGGSTQTFTSGGTLYAQWTSTTTKGNATLASAIKKADGALQDTNYDIIYHNGNYIIDSVNIYKFSQPTFSGWKIDNTVYKAGASYKPNGPDKEAEAVWSEKDVIKTEYAETILAPEGQIFAGWSTTPVTNPNEATIAYKPGAPITPTGNTNVKLYAIFKAGINYVLNHNRLITPSNTWRAVINALKSSDDNVKTHSALYPIFKKDGYVNNFDYKTESGVSYVTYKNNIIGKLNTDGTISKTKPSDGFSTGGTWYYIDPNAN